MVLFEFSYNYGKQLRCPNIEGKYSMHYDYYYDYYLFDIVWKHVFIMYTPVNPSFTIYKWGLRGQNYIYVFVM